MEQNLEEIAESEVVNQLSAINFNNPNDIDSVSDGVTNLKNYVENAYGIELHDWDYRTAKTNLDITNLKVIQNGIEIGKMQRMSQLSDEEFKTLCEKNPLKVISARSGQYVVNGNHRLLSALLRGIEYVPVEILSIRDRDKSTSLGLNLDSQSNMVK